MSIQIYGLMEHFSRKNRSFAIIVGFLLLSVICAIYIYTYKYAFISSYSHIHHIMSHVAPKNDVYPPEIPVY